MCREQMKASSCDARFLAPGKLFASGLVIGMAMLASPAFSAPLGASAGSSAQAADEGANQTAAPKHHPNNFTYGVVWYFSDGTSRSITLLADNLQDATSEAVPAIAPSAVKLCIFQAGSGFGCP